MGLLAAPIQRRPLPDRERLFQRIRQLKAWDPPLSNAAIAERLGVSERTVKVYVRAAKAGTVPYALESAREEEP